MPGTRRSPPARPSCWRRSRIRRCRRCRRTSGSSRPRSSPRRCPAIPRRARSSLSRSRASFRSSSTAEMKVLTFEIPTDRPESDGTLDWDSTTIVIVAVEASGQTGIGYTYSDAATAQLIESKLSPLLDDHDPMAPPATWMRMRAELRNVGQQGIGAMAISAVDIALWDLKAKLLGIPLADALPRFHDAVPVYGSGGFTSYSLAELEEQLRGWVEQGFTRVKIKVGRDPGADPERLDVARQAIGPNVE